MGRGKERNYKFKVNYSKKTLKNDNNDNSKPPTFTKISPAGRK
jgi:hypothetical protein